MKRFSLPLVLALTAAPVFADNVTVFKVKEDGTGVIEYESPLTLNEASVLIDEKRPADVTGVVLEKGKPVKWTNLSSDQINENFGGEGEPEMLILEEEKTNIRKDGETADDEMTFEDPEADETANDEMTFEGPSQIKPQAGTWFGEIINQTFDGCPAAIATAAKTQTASISGSLIQGNIDESFTPSRMAPQFDWKKTGDNSWVGTLDKMTNGTGVRIQWAMEVKTPIFIESRQQLNFALGPLGNCEAFTTTYLGLVK